MILSSPLIYFLQPRLPTSSVSHHPRHGVGFLRSSTFWLLQIDLIMESLGYFIPRIYLRTFAPSLGLSSSIGTVLIALVNAVSVLSTIMMGMLIDRFHVRTVILLSTVGVTISAFLFWGFSDASHLLVVFSVLYDFFAGGFVSTNASVIKVVKTLDENTNVGSLIGLLSARRGIGAMVSGPLSRALLPTKPWHGITSLGYDSAYGGLIMFTGITAALGGVSVLGKRLG